MIDKAAIAEELQDMLDTAQAVRGEDFADFARFLGNCNTATKIAAMAIRGNTELPDNVLEKMGESFCSLMSGMCNDYANVLQLSETLREEAMTLVDNIESKMAQRVKEARDVGG